VSVLDDGVGVVSERIDVGVAVVVLTGVGGGVGDGAALLESALPT